LCLVQRQRDGGIVVELVPVGEIPGSAQHSAFPP
jgi:hypothetical protein